MRQCKNFRIGSEITDRDLIYISSSPDASMVEPANFIAPRNGFAMSFQDFVPHLMNVLDQLGMSLHARTAFIKYVDSCDREALADSFPAIIYRPSLRTRTLHIDFYRLAKLLPQLTSQ